MARSAHSRQAEPFRRRVAREQAKAVQSRKAHTIHEPSPAGIRTAVKQAMARTDAVAEIDSRSISASERTNLWHRIEREAARFGYIAQYHPSECSIAFMLYRPRR